MNVTKDINKSCMSCNCTYVEDIWFDIVCKHSHEPCIIDIENDIFGICDKWERDSHWEENNV